MAASFRGHQAPPPPPPPPPHENPLTQSCINNPVIACPDSMPSGSQGTHHHHHP
ncbi:hypothetical protein B0T17DRAFT_529348 [Bombardia bombarda]|uniref:Uncharacterized protein n=1 Tax=Bombardia bombarda TaxID=252184 RepID=A0AA40CA62_9PEZI|nr:hypothetical protein B0T17DRAFT_529348 [Bombardia bombarda]